MNETTVTPEPPQTLPPGLGWTTYHPHSPGNAKVSAALVKAQAEVHTAGKTGDNKFDKYTYSKLEDFLAVAKPVLAKHGLSIAMSTIDTITLEPRTTKNGGIEHAVRVRVMATLRHESGESLDFIGYGEGQDRADKAVYKAITGARKYAIAGALAIPTSDDPEADEKVGLSGKGNAPRQKLDSTGVERSKIPPWSDKEKIQAGTYNAQILTLLEAQYGNGDAAQDELGDWKNRHKYDDPPQVLEALKQWIADLGGVA